MNYKINKRRNNDLFLEKIQGAYTWDSRNMNSK